MITDSAFLGNGVYVDEDQYGTITLSYGGNGAPGVALNKEAIESLLIFLKVKPLYNVTGLRTELRKAARLRKEAQDANS